MLSSKQIRNFLGKIESSFLKHEFKALNSTDTKIFKMALHKTSECSRTERVKY